MSKINTGYSLNECPPIKETIIHSIQQIIVAVFNVIPVPLLIGAGIGLSSSEITILVAGCLLVTGIATILQTIGIGPVGARLLMLHYLTGNSCRMREDVMIRLIVL